MGNSLSSDDFKCIGGESWYRVCDAVERNADLIGTMLQELSCHSIGKTLWRQPGDAWSVSRERIHSFFPSSEYPVIRELTKDMYVLEMS